MHASVIWNPQTQKVSFKLEEVQYIFELFIWVLRLPMKRISYDYSNVKTKAIIPPYKNCPEVVNQLEYHIFLIIQADITYIFNKNQKPKKYSKILQLC